MVTPATERKAVAHLVDAYGMSERRACKAIGCCRMTMRYKTTRADDATLRQRMKAIAHERRRFGYRRLHVLLKREGYLINHKKLFRLYRVREARGAPPWRPQAGNRNQSTDAACDHVERPMVARLCVGSADRRPPLPHPDCRE